jgi:hypothetical protein
MNRDHSTRLELLAEAAVVVPALCDRLGRLTAEVTGGEDGLFLSKDRGGHERHHHR